MNKQSSKMGKISNDKGKNLDMLLTIMKCICLHKKLLPSSKYSFEFDIDDSGKVYCLTYWDSNNEKHIVPTNCEYLDAYGKDAMKIIKM